MMNQEEFYNINMGDYCHQQASIDFGNKFHLGIPQNNFETICLEITSGLSV
jgi:hypothetical protein